MNVYRIPFFHQEETSRGEPRAHYLEAVEGEAFADPFARGWFERKATVERRYRNLCTLIGCLAAVMLTRRS